MAPLTINGKCKLKELGVRGLDWDEPIMDAEKKWWEKVLSQLKELKKEIKTCLLENEEDIKFQTTHIL